MCIILDKVGERAATGHSLQVFIDNIVVGSRGIVQQKQIDRRYLIELNHDVLHCRGQHFQRTESRCSALQKTTFSTTWR